MKHSSLTRRAVYRARLSSPDYRILVLLQEFLLSELAVTPGALVVDIGCGEQPFRRVIEAQHARYLGVDVSQNARRTVSLLAELSGLPLADGCVDVILCTEVLEHVPDARLAIREMARVLRPGGRLICTTPFLYPLHEEPHDYTRMTVFYLSTLAREYQLEIVRLEKLGTAVDVLVTLWCHLWAGPSAFRKPFRYLWRGAMRLGANAIASVVSHLMGAAAPRRLYLSNVCTFQKGAS